MSCVSRAALAVVATAVSLGSTALAQPQIDRIEFAPLDDWKLERLEDSCVFTRHFGDPDDAVTMQLDSVDPWDGGFRVTLSGGGVDWAVQEFRAGWLPGGRFVRVRSPNVLTRENGSKAILFHHGLWNEAALNMSTDEWREFDRNQGIEKWQGALIGFSVKGLSGKEVLIRTGPMGTLIERRDECIGAMLAARGVDPADEHRSDNRVTMVNRIELAKHVFAMAPSTLNRDKEGTWIDFLFYVDGKGRATYCRLLTLPYDVEFERVSCDYLSRKARFHFNQGESAQPTFYKLTMLSRR